jgi:hypothetical protein
MPISRSRSSCFFRTARGETGICSCVCVIDEIAQHQRGAFLPGDAAQRRHVGDHRMIAIAGFPARRLVAGHRLHLHVDGQEVVAAVCFVLGAVEEVLDVEPLADQAALHVGVRGDHRIDLARLGGDFQFL